MLIDTRATRFAKDCMRLEFVEILVMGQWMLPASQQPIKKVLPYTLPYYSIPHDTYLSTDKTRRKSVHDLAFANPDLLSLTHGKTYIKPFRHMTTKTHSPQTQFTCAKYLIQLVSFYTNNNQTNNQAVSVASAKTRNRLQEETEYWIDKLSKSNYPEVLYIKGH
ncbi:unnamed protein product [Rhizopus stolonifer]